ncbi:MAG TPA: L-fucose/L-arabinose isomerase family protein [Acidobacteriaceae bacterium]|nr:L-fucose/L-arabinose isomerase family protein [Acidobacteriaceae bacterium]
MTKKLTFGLIVGNRGFFPDHLAKEGRDEMLAVFEKAGIRAITLTPEESKFGSVETHDDAIRCGDLFRKHRDEIDGIIVTLPNFGDERGIADSIRYSRLSVPILVQATPDRRNDMKISDRRDSFCGKMSACNNLMQYGIPYSITARHTVQPNSDEFRKDLDWFSKVCRVTNGLRKLRIGAIGARPQAFNTVRYSEKLLERYGISVVTQDLSDIFGVIGRMKDSDSDVAAKLAAIQAYVSTDNVPAPALLKMAKLGVAVERFMKDAHCTVSAIQCWTSLEENFGVVPCTIMSMMSDNLIPAACETDVMGTVSMHALALASQTPSALLDWNNNYGDDENKCVCFHCSNLPKHFFADVIMDFQAIIAGTVGKENTFGTCVGRVKAGAMSYVRFSTDDYKGKIRGYVGEGEFTNDPLETFGGAGVAKIPQMQKLLHKICEEGFEHHVAANFSNVASPVYEAAIRYLGWEMYWHER